MDARFKLWENKEHGVILRISDEELADEFDDFINEECYVLSDMGFEPGVVCFYFGLAASVEKVRKLIDNFMSRQGT